MESAPKNRQLRTCYAGYVPNGTVHSGCSDPTQATTHLVVILVSPWPCKRDEEERYWGQQFCQTETDISVRPIEMTRPVKVDHLQSWFRTFRSDQNE